MQNAAEGVSSKTVYSGASKKEKASHKGGELKVLSSNTKIFGFLRDVYRTETVELLPSMLTIRKKDSNKTKVFLLAPLGLTNIVQTKADLLVLISTIERDDKNLKMTDKDELIVCFKRQVTLKFVDGNERNEWMKAIIAECDRNYLLNLPSNSIKCSESFWQGANEEIWKRILSPEGDEPLRAAYVAVDHERCQVVRLIVDCAIKWLQMLLAIVGPMRDYHKEPFAALFSLLVELCASFFLHVQT